MNWKSNVSCSFELINLLYQINVDCSNILFEDCPTLINLYPRLCAYAHLVYCNLIIKNEK